MELRDKYRLQLYSTDNLHLSVRVFVILSEI